MSTSTSKPLKPKRGTTAQNNNYTGEAYEVTLDTDKKTLVVHDGLTAGGFPLARADEVAQKDAEQDVAIAEAQSSADAASEDVTALDTTLRRLIAEELQKYLPLSGGVLNGRLYVPSRLEIMRSQWDAEGTEILLQGKNDATVNLAIDNNDGVLRFIQYASPDGSISRESVVKLNISDDIFQWKDISRDPRYFGFPLTKTISYSITANTNLNQDFVAPDNGFYTAAVDTTGRSSYLTLTNMSCGINMSCNFGEDGTGIFRAFVPAKKGDTVKLTYGHNGTNTWHNFMFVYGG